MLLCVVHEVRLYAQDGVDSVAPAGLVRLDATGHGPVIGEGQGGLPEFGSPLSSFVYPDDGVVDAVLRVEMRVKERHCNARRTARPTSTDAPATPPSPGPH